MRILSHNVCRMLTAILILLHLFNNIQVTNVKLLVANGRATQKLSQGRSPGGDTLTPIDLSITEDRARDAKG